MAVIYALGGIWSTMRRCRCGFAGLSARRSVAHLRGFGAVDPADRYDRCRQLDLATGGFDILLRRFGCWWPTCFWCYDQRDRSVLVSSFAHLAVLPAIYRIAAPRDHAEAGIFFILAAAVLYCIAAFLRNSSVKPSEPHGRVFLLRLRLPFDAGKINNIGLGAGVTTLVMLLFALFNASN
ncbi:MAG: hypothetical protein U1F27_13500 [Turneriella sp.]